MKRTIYFMGLILFIMSLKAVAQDKSPNQVMINAGLVPTRNFYVKADFGITFGLDPVILNQTNTTSNETNTTTVSKAVSARLGSGMPIGVAGGFKFSKTFGVELGIDYNYGFSTKVNNLLNGESTKITVSASTLSVTPSVLAQFQTGLIFPYVRVGPEIAVVNNYRTLTVGLVSTFKTTGSTGERDTRDYGGIAIGIKAAAGVEYPITKLVSIFGEVQARAISFFPKHGKVTKYTVDGVDQLSTLGTKQTKWDYVKSVTYPDQISNDQPNQFLRVSHAVSNVGLVVGVKLNFGK
jgi:hypothetical protein